MNVVKPTIGYIECFQRPRCSCGLLSFGIGRMTSSNSPLVNSTLPDEFGGNEFLSGSYRGVGQTPWIRSKTLRLQHTCTTGLACPVDVSQNSVTHRCPKGTGLNSRLVGGGQVRLYACISGSSLLSAAMTV